MAGITLAQAQTQLDAYLAAEIAVLKNQSYKVGTREFTRADLKDILDGIERWSAKVEALSSSRANGGRGRSIVPRPTF